jgi:hypothetical protein
MKKKPTLKSLAAEIRQLRERLEDLEDLMDLRAAVERNAGRPGSTWELVKKELDIESLGPSIPMSEIRKKYYLQ